MDRYAGGQANWLCHSILNSMRAAMGKPAEPKASLPFSGHEAVWSRGAEKQRQWGLCFLKLPCPAALRNTSELFLPPLAPKLCMPKHCQRQWHKAKLVHPITSTSMHRSGTVPWLPVAVGCSPEVAVHRSLQGAHCIIPRFPILTAPGSVSL